MPVWNRLDMSSGFHEICVFVLRGFIPNERGGPPVTFARVGNHVKRIEKYGGCRPGREAAEIHEKA